mgnify:CR=1 FL=1
MGNRVRLTNDTLNSYGYRVLTEGVDITQYERNPILLYMHNRGKAIGLIKDIKRENGEITGEPVFDEATELSCQCKKQWDFGSLRMVSIGFEVIETSEAPEHLVTGQRYATVTKSRLIEVSLVDIGANNDAIRLHKNGQLITLGDGGDCPLPLLNHNPNNNPQMDIKTLALQLGLPETADEAAVNAKLAELKRIIIRYYPSGSTNELNGVLFDIFTCERDLASHNDIEDRLFIPAIKRLEEQTGTRGRASGAQPGDMPPKQPAPKKGGRR